MRSSFQAGSIIKVKRKGVDCWRFRYRQNGIQRSDYIGTTNQYPTKASAEKAADKMRGLLNLAPTEIITVSDLIDRYEKDAMPDRPTTSASYRSIFRRIRESWGETRLDKFSLDMVSVETWLKDMKIIGRHPRMGAPKLVSSLYRAQVRNLLHLLVEHGMKWGAIQTQRNPIELIRLKDSSTRAKELVIVNLNQYQALLDDPQLPEVVKTMIQIAAGLGLRVSEILGLKWSDCNFEDKTIEIQRSVVHGQANDTKTSTSRQTLPLHDNLIEILRTWKEQEAFKSKWIFCSERTGRPYDRDWLRSEYLQPAGERIGLPGLGWHSFRHTYRAMQKNAGLSLEDQKSLMRHARIGTTIDTYGGNDNLERTRPANAKVVEMLPVRRSA